MNKDSLTRLPDPVPDVWLNDFTQIMESTALDEFSHFGPAYGNFWPAHPCRLKPHDWQALRTEPGEWGTQIRRCQRCGAQVDQWINTAPPVRGKL